jgi:hypothetical protein
MATTLHSPDAPATLERAPGRGDLTARLRRLVRGRVADPAWVLPALLGLLALTALLYRPSAPPPSTASPCTT